MSSAKQHSWPWARVDKSRKTSHSGYDNQQTMLPSTSSSSDCGSAEDDEHLLEKEMEFTHRTACQQRARVSSIALIAVAILLSSICSAGFVFLFNSNTFKHVGVEQAGLSAPFRPVPRLRHCGTNAEEARSLGCKFQIWSYSWVPPECYDGELVQEWLEMRNWEYYDDRYQRGKVVNFTTEVLTGERLLYSTWGQHYWHCAFTWRKWLRASLGSGVGITDQDLDYHHANHCQDTIRNKPDYRPWDENDIELTVGFHSC